MASGKFNTMGKIKVKKTRHSKVYKVPNAERPDTFTPFPFSDYCEDQSFIPKTVILFKSNRAFNNFLKHSKSNDVKKIEAMFKRGTAIKRPMKGLQVL